MDEDIEQAILERLKQNNIWFKLMGRRYSGNDQYHNWYIVGMNDKYIFGEMEFSANPTWRLSWYNEGKTWHDSGFLLTSLDKFIKKILKMSIPGVKKKRVDEKKAEFASDFE